ncbi:MAG: hypothetical protein ACK56W_14990 [Pirellula sp.]|jgi:hypothetical protein|nr:hypothetical protein [Pirellula sp.]
MKIHNLAQIAITCLALLSPRLIASGGVFGGAVGPEPELECNRAHKAHQCSGPTHCGTIGTTEESTNRAELLYREGNAKRYCTTGEDACEGSALAPDPKECKRPKPKDQEIVLPE